MESELSVRVDEVRRRIDDSARELERVQGIVRDLVEKGREIQRTRGEGGAEQAVAIYEEALTKDSLCAPALWELGWSYQVQGKLVKFLKII